MSSLTIGSPGGVIHGCRHQRCSRLQLSGMLVLALALIYVRSSQADNATVAVHKHLCLEDDYTNDLPIFIERQIICNFESVPIQIYTIKTMPDSVLNTEYCLKGKYQY